MKHKHLFLSVAYQLIILIINEIESQNIIITQNSINSTSFGKSKKNKRYLNLLVI